jgi:hypothetical protein
MFRTPCPTRWRKLSCARGDSGKIAREGLIAVTPRAASSGKGFVLPLPTQSISQELTGDRRISLYPIYREDTLMGRGILLWLLGVPLPIIILLALFWH